MRQDEREYLVRVAPDFPAWEYEEGVWGDCAGQLARRLDCPELAQSWPV